MDNDLDACDGSTEDEVPTCESIIEGMVVSLKEMESGKKDFWRYLHDARCCLEGWLERRHDQ